METDEGYMVSLRGDENVPKLDCGDGCTTLGIYQKTLNCTLLCEFYRIGSLS